MNVSANNCRTSSPEQPDERLLAAPSAAVSLLCPAHDQIQLLTAQRVEAKGPHAKDQSELAASEMRGDGDKGWTRAGMCRSGCAQGPVRMIIKDQRLSYW